MIMCCVRRKSHILFVAFLSTVLCGIVAYIYAFNIFIGTRSSSALPLQFLKKIKMLSVSDQESKRVRVLCWVVTCPKNLDRKAMVVRSTWGKRCYILLFMSSVRNDSFPTIGLNVSEGREHLTAKSMLSLQYIHDHYYDKADWFLKADDDTYVIVENLRNFLSAQNTSEPIYFGHHFKSFIQPGYMSGGAGYCLSKEALKRIGQNAKKNVQCRSDGGFEDQEIGKCLMHLGVRAGNSTDSLGRNRFHCFDPESHLLGKYPRWFYSWDDHGGRKGEESISNNAISFHYVSPEMMKILEMSIYHIKVST